MESLTKGDVAYVQDLVETIRQNPDVPIMPVAKLLIGELELKVGPQAVYLKLKELINA